MAANRHFGFGFPLRPDQAESELVWEAIDRPGLSLIQVERFGAPRLRSRGTARALRRLARDLDCSFADCLRLEREAVRIHRRGQRLQGSDLHRPFRQLLDRLGAGEDLSSRDLPEPDELHSAAALQGRRDLVARFGQLVLIRRGRRYEACTWPTEQEACGHYRAVVFDLEEHAARLREERLLACVVRPGQRRRPSALALRTA
jgi:hypothetical protein